MRAPGTTPTISGRAYAQSMWPSAMWVTRAGTEKIATATRLEATADFIGTRNGPVSTGTITMPPPTPSRPATNPDAAPRATSSGKGCREPLAPPAVGPAGGALGRVDALIDPAQGQVGAEAAVFRWPAQWGNGPLDGLGQPGQALTAVVQAGPDDVGPPEVGKTTTPGHRHTE